MAEANTPDPIPPQPFADEDWKKWVARFLAWLRSQWPTLATKDYVRQQIEAAFKARGM